MKELLLLFLGLLSIARAENPLWMDPPRDVDTQLLDRAERLLTGGHEDQDPALSPDGRWLAWSRSMDGNRDIWLLDLEDPAAAPLRVTRHVAADYAPSFDPAGRSLLFISEREDVRGDIWQVTLFSRLGLKSSFKASRRLERSGEQAWPCLDSHGCLYWDEESPQGRRIMQQRPNGDISELASSATRPRISTMGLCYIAILKDGREAVMQVPDSLLQDGEFTPAGNEIAAATQGFADLACDTDGRIVWIRDRSDFSLGGLPGWSSLAIEVREMNADGVVPFLAPMPGLRQLSITQNRVVLAMDGGELRLRSASGGFPPSGNAKEWSSLAASLRGKPEEEGCLARLVTGWPADSLAALAMLDWLDLALARGYEATVLDGLFKRAENLRSGEEWSRQLSLRHLRQTGEMSSQRADSLDRAWRSGAAHAGLLLLAAAQADREPSRQLELLQRIDHRLLDPQSSIRAWLHAAAAADAVGDRAARDEALAGLLALCQLQPEAPSPWLASRLKALEAESNPAEGLLRLHRELAAFPPLRDAVWLEYIRHAMGQGLLPPELAQADLALLGRRNFEKLHPFDRMVWCEAQVVESQVLLSDGRLDDALELLESSVIQAGDDPALARWLAAHRLRLLLDEARRVIGRDPLLASVLAGQALGEDENSIAALRLRLQGLAAAGELSRDEDSLRQRIRATNVNPRAFDLYALGLLLSWKAEEDPAALAESQALLDAALNLDPTMAAAAVTQSWNLSRLLAQVEGRRGGLAGLLRELERGREAFGRLKHLGLTRLEDQDAEQLRNTALNLLVQAERHYTPSDGQDLMVAIQQNRGNLYFSLGEFGARRARLAWLERLRLSSEFPSPQDELLFRAKLGIAAHWDGSTEIAREHLAQAENLAALLGEDELRIALTGRRALLALESAEPEIARELFQQSLLLETDPGQRSLLLRDLVLLAIQSGDEDEARALLLEADQQLAQGELPFKPEQNWLRMQILGLSVPVWNFTGLYTGEGRLDWGRSEEKLLRQAFRDGLDLRAGRLDQVAEGLDERIRRIRGDGDPLGQFQLELDRAGLNALLGHGEEGLKSALMLARRARDELDAPGLMRRAAELALGILALPGGMELEASMEALSQCETMLAPAGDEAESAAQLLGGLMLELRARSLRIRAEGPGSELLQAGEALLQIAASRRQMINRGWLITGEERLALDLSEADFLLSIGMTHAASELLGTWQISELPVDQALVLACLRIDLALMAEDRITVASLLEELFQRLDWMPPGQTGLARLRQQESLLPGLRHAFERGYCPQRPGMPADTLQFDNWLAWWLARRDWDQTSPHFASGNLRDTWQASITLGQRREGLLKHAQQTIERDPDSLIALAMPLGPELDLLAEKLSPADRAWLRWQYPAHVQAPLRRAPLGLALLAGDTKDGAPGARELLAETPIGLDHSCLLVEGSLHLQNGLASASWIQAEKLRIDLRDLASRRLNAQFLIVQQMEKSTHEELNRFRACLELLLPQMGLQAFLWPAEESTPSTVEREARLLLAGLPSESFWEYVGTVPFNAGDTPQERFSLSNCVEEGRQAMREADWLQAWRAFRLGLEHALVDSTYDEIPRLLRFSAQSALRGGLPESAWPDLRKCLDRLDLATLDLKQFAPDFVLLAELAGDPAAADRLQAMLIDADPASARKLQLDRMEDLVNHGRLHRAAWLGRQSQILPLGSDPRQILFLADLYHRVDMVDLAERCLGDDRNQWQQLPQQVQLDLNELAALNAACRGDLENSRRHLATARALAERNSFKPERLLQLVTRELDCYLELADRTELASLIQLGDSLGGQQSGQLRIDWLRTKARALSEACEPARALDALDDARREAEGLSGSDLLIECTLDLARYHLLDSHPVQAVQWLDRAGALPGGGAALDLEALRLRILAEVELYHARTQGESTLFGFAGDALQKFELRRKLEELSDTAFGQLRDTAPVLGAEAGLGLLLAMGELHLALEDGAGLKLVEDSLGQLEDQANSLLAAGRMQLMLARIEARTERRAAARSRWMKLLKENARYTSLQGNPRPTRSFDLMIQEASGHLAENEAAVGNALASLAALENRRQVIFREFMFLAGRTTSPAGGDTTRIRVLLDSLPADTDLLSIACIEDRLRWILWHEGQLATGLLPEPLSAVNALIESHLERLDQQEVWRVTAQELGRVLLPESLQSETPKRLLLIVDDELSSLPFASLQLPTGELLIERTIIHEADSFSMFEASLAAGNPSATGILSMNPEGAGLPYAELAAGELGWLWPESRHISGLQAERKALLDAAPVAFLLLAAHASDADCFSGGRNLLLADSRVPLTAFDLAEDGPACELALLAACGPVELVASSRKDHLLAAGLLAAGSRQVIAARWPVRDHAAGQFSKHLSRQLALGKDPGTSMQAASLAMIKAGEAPASWSTFVLFGFGGELELPPSTVSRQENHR